MKNLSIEAGVFLMIFLFALGGFANIYVEENGLTGLAITESILSTPQWSGSGVRTFDLSKAQGPVIRINGWTSSWHSSTGKHFAFTFNLKSKGKIVWTYTTGNYGGQRQGRVGMEIKVPNISADLLEVRAFATKGKPPIEGYQFNVVYSIKQQVISPTLTSSPIITEQKRPSPYKSTIRSTCGNFGQAGVKIEGLESLCQVVTKCRPVKDGLLIDLPGESELFFKTNFACGVFG